LWVLVAYNTLEKRTAVLLTNVPIRSEADALQVYSDWRLQQDRTRLSFDQNSLMAKTCASRLWNACVAVRTGPGGGPVFHLMHRWPRKAVYWLRKLGGKLGLKTDRDGPYIVLPGISAVFLTAATLSLVAISPFPHILFSSG
jgi:hypothetical protein